MTGHYLSPGVGGGRKGGGGGVEDLGFEDLVLFSLLIL